MDDFTPYCCEFHEALSKLWKVLKKCIEVNLSLSPEKCELFINVGILLGHSISKEGIQVNPNKFSMIKRVPIPQNKSDVTSFLGLDGYYKSFIKYFSKLSPPLFCLLDKDSDFCGTRTFKKPFKY